MDKFHKGFIISHNGYRLLMAKDHPKKDCKGYVREHILIMEAHLGRYLTSDEVVHHIDENKLNNDISNLQLMTKWEHKSYHSSKPRKPIEQCSKDWLRKKARKLKNDMKI